MNHSHLHLNFGGAVRWRLVLRGERGAPAAVCSGCCAFLSDIRVPKDLPVERTVIDLPEAQKLAADGSALRETAIGRKIQLSAGSEDAGEAACAITGLIEAAKANNINPQPWLENVLRKLPQMKSNWPSMHCWRFGVKPQNKAPTQHFISVPKLLIGGYYWMKLGALVQGTGLGGRVGSNPGDTFLPFHALSRTNFSGKMSQSSQYRATAPNDAPG